MSIERKGLKKVAKLSFIGNFTKEHMELINDYVLGLCDLFPKHSLITVSMESSTMITFKNVDGKVLNACYLREIRDSLSRENHHKDVA